jgi:hypothetical protein
MRYGGRRSCRGRLEGITLAAFGCLLRLIVFRSERECEAWLILGRGLARSGLNSRCRWRRCCRSRCRTRCWR